MSIINIIDTNINDLDPTPFEIVEKMKKVQ